MPAKQQLDKLSWQWTETVQPEAVTREHVELAYRIGLDPCQRNICRRNCKGNPNCLIGLGEKEWLCDIDEDKWHEIEDPNLERRQKDSFVGLKNLGATCYVNTFLQVWFHNRSFRRALYKWQPLQLCALSSAHNQSGSSSSSETLTPTCICSHLQLLFALLQFTNRRDWSAGQGKPGSYFMRMRSEFDVNLTSPPSFRRDIRKYIDPSGLVNCLGLDAALQQDAQEFSKLFMSLLEETLSQQTQPDVRNIIQQQFCGQYAYVTRCNNCGNGSERPSKFYELDLNIKGHRELKECLGEFLQDEHLEGSNQYLCDCCKTKQNATRRIQLLSLPPVLNIQLLRFIFDRQTGTKKKLNSFIQFPEVLDMTPYLPKEDLDTIYELTAVLIHRGPTAYSGHYVAHIREEGVWHKFNDEEVERIEGRNLKLGSEDDLQDSGVKLGKRPKNIKGFHASKNAYMLVYKRKTPETQPDTSQLDVISEVTLPAYLQALIKQDRQQFEDWAMDMTNMREKSIANGKARHEEVTRLYLMLPPKPGESYEWVRSDWLKHWLNTNNSTPCKPIDNSDLRCCHGNLDPDKIQDVKRVTQEAAAVLLSKYGGGPSLTANNLCLKCVREQCHLMRLKTNLNEDSKFVAGATKSKLDPGSPGFWLGKSSLRNWRKKVLQREEQNESRQDDPSKPDDKEGQADESAIEEIFNGELLCPHNNLSTNETLRKLVSIEVWQRLRRYFPDAPEFDQDQQMCQICRAQEEEEQQENNLRILMATDQKTALPQLFNDRHRPSWDKKDMMEVYAISRPFVEQWREFVRQPLKVSPQNAVNNSMLLCHHDKFIFETGYMDELAQNMYALVWPHEWVFISKNFQVDFTIRIHQKVESLENGQMQTLISEPESCVECIAARHSQANLERKEYSGARIYIRKIAMELTSAGPALVEDDQKGASEGLSRDTDPDFFQVNGAKRLKTSSDCESVRRSSRHRKVRGEKEVIVSSTNTLKELKIKVMHAFSVAPFDQTLVLRGLQLADNAATLSNLGVEPECVITLKVDMPLTEDPLVMDEIYRASNVPEEGFKGTGLLGSGL